MEGIVMQSTGAWYEVKGRDQRLYACRLAGRLRLEDKKLTNPVAVGDHVDFKIEDGNDSVERNETSNDLPTGVITKVMPRQNYIIRESPYRKYYAQILAANLDQAILVAQAALLKSTPIFIDRFLVAAESFNITPVLIFNKTDLLTATQQEELSSFRTIYESIGYKTLALSALNGDHLEDFFQLLHGQTSLVLGYSGVGKSTLINTVSPKINQKVGTTQVASQKGRHTTTYATMFEVGPHSYLIDTPGIQELTPFEIDAPILGDCFPEIRNRKAACKFHNCLHLKEPQCSVLAALEKEEITYSRYLSYIKLLEQIQS